MKNAFKLVSCFYKSNYKYKRDKVYRKIKVRFF